VGSEERGSCAGCFFLCCLKTSLAGLSLATHLKIQSHLRKLRPPCSFLGVENIRIPSPPRHSLLFLPNLTQGNRNRAVLGFSPRSQDPALAPRLQSSSAGFAWLAYVCILILEVHTSKSAQVILGGAVKGKEGMLLSVTSSSEQSVKLLPSSRPEHERTRHESRKKKISPLLMPTLLFS